MAMFKEVITLISNTFTIDELGQRIQTNSSRDVYANKKPIIQSEFFQAFQNGIKANHILVIRQADYNNELEIIFNGMKLEVYRIFEKGENVELYCQRRLGND